MIEFFVSFLVEASVQSIKSSSKNVKKYHVLMGHFLQAILKIVPFLFNHVCQRDRNLLLPSFLNFTHKIFVFWRWKVLELRILYFDFDLVRVAVWIIKNTDNLIDDSIESLCLVWVNAENVPSFHLYFEYLYKLINTFNI